MSNLNHITELLESSYYQLAGDKITIGSVSFEFELVFLGEQYASDIIVVVDLRKSSESETIQAIRSLARALDFNHSARPVTCILVGKSANQDTLSVLSQVCRVQNLEQPDLSIEDVKDRIRVLLPVEFVLPNELTADHKNELLNQLNKPVNDALFDEFYFAANLNQLSVSELLKRKIEKFISKSDHQKSIGVAK